MSVDCNQNRSPRKRDLPEVWLELTPADEVRPTIDQRLIPGMTNAVRLLANTVFVDDMREDPMFCPIVRSPLLKGVVGEQETINTVVYELILSYLRERFRPLLVIPDAQRKANPAEARQRDLQPRANLRSAMYAVERVCDPYQVACPLANLEGNFGNLFKNTEFVGGMELVDDFLRDSCHPVNRFAKGVLWEVAKIASRGVTRDDALAVLQRSVEDVFRSAEASARQFSRPTPSASMEFTNGVALWRSRAEIWIRRNLPEKPCPLERRTPTLGRKTN